MSFIRPEVSQQLFRWRETLTGAVASALGAYWMIGSSGALALIGTVLTVGGALLAVAGLQRARFRVGSNGPGVVQIDEGQLAYFGPVDGGVVAIDDLTRIDLEPSGRFSSRWVLWHHGGEPVTIPVDARGADALFDVFAALPGIHTDAMLARLARRPRSTVTIWQRELRRLH